jgi:hypothetical protein
MDDIVSMDEEVACILLELPQREIGGQLPRFETLEKISEWCGGKGIKFHLDGAILPPKERTAQILAEVQQQTGIGFSGYVTETGSDSCCFEAGLGDSYAGRPKKRLRKLSCCLLERSSTPFEKV